MEAVWLSQIRGRPGESPTIFSGIKRPREEAATSIPYLGVSSHLYYRALTGDTLPLPARHLHPCVGKALVNIHSLSCRICAFCFEGSRRDCRITKCCHFQIVVIDTFIFGRFRGCQHLSLTSDFPFGISVHELVSYQGSHQVRIICLLGLKPLLFQSGKIAFSVAPLLSCDHATLPSESIAIKHHNQVLFIDLPICSDFQLVLVLQHRTCGASVGSPASCHKSVGTVNSSSW